MVATTTLLDSESLATPGRGADGVVRVKLTEAGESTYGSGVLLYDGRHILTARHLMTGLSTPVTLVYFETPAGIRSLSVTDARGLKSWNSKSVEGDLLLLALAETAPADASRATLYRGNDEIGQPFVMIGYGRSGTGSTGQETMAPSSTVRRFAENRFDGEMSDLKALAGSRLGWTPPAQSQLWADFDNGQPAQDATRLWTGKRDLGRGTREGMITSGDSGSPAFIDGKLAGLASYTFTSSAPAGESDIDQISNVSFGELGVWQRISHYQQWIDTNLRKSYPDAPTRSQDVKKDVPEGNAGTSYAYFLLQFHGVRSDPTEKLSVDYATRDGTAKADEDYLATSGTLVLYPDETQAVIAVEILGDIRREPDETFYLDVTNPVGGSFSKGVSTLTAMRTIVDDDGPVKMVGVAEGLYVAG